MAKEVLGSTYKERVVKNQSRRYFNHQPPCFHLTRWLILGKMCVFFPHNPLLGRDWLLVFWRLATGKSLNFEKWWSSSRTEEFQAMSVSQSGFVTVLFVPILISSLLVPPYHWIPSRLGWDPSRWTNLRNVCPTSAATLSVRSPHLRASEMFFGARLDCLERKQVAGPGFFCWDDALKSNSFWKMLEDRFPLHHWKLYHMLNPKINVWFRCFFPF